MAAPVTGVSSGESEAIVPYSRWNARLPELKKQFEEADPYPHVVLDDFLNEAAALVCVREFPGSRRESWTNYTHVNERKYAKSDMRSFPPFIRSVIEELNSPRLLRFLEGLTGIRDLIADDALMGGGLHRSGKGGFLNIHADFTGHPHHARWKRRINLLIYLNPDWQESYGGHLELWDKTVTRCVQRIPPLFNRAVIFRTDPDSFHGHPDPMTCPDDFMRRSMALYYFTDEQESFKIRSTEYRPRPGDGARGLAIYLDKMVLRGYDRAKRMFGFSDEFAGRLLRRVAGRKRE
jgi:hypothetical protein